MARSVFGQSAGQRGLGALGQGARIIRPRGGASATSKSGLRGETGGRGRPRAGKERSASIHLYRGLLEDRSSQLVELSFAQNGPACTEGNPRLRHDDWQRDCAALGTTYVGSLC